MRLNNVWIKNFRGLRKFSITFSDKAILVGSNNTCKTTILDAINLVLYPGFYYGPGLLSEYDFYNRKFELPEDQIHIEVRFTNLTGDEQLYFGDHVEPVKQDGSVIDAAPGTEIFDKASKILRIYFSSEFSDGEIQCGVFYARHADSVPVPKRDRRAIGFQYLSLSRIIERAFSLTGNSTMQRIMRRKEIDLRQEQSRILAQFPEISNILLSNANFKELLDNLEINFRDFVYFADIEENSQKLKYEISDLSFSEINKSIQMFLHIANSSQALPLTRQGNGTQNAISMALLMYLGNLQGNAIIAIDEPELSLHPHAQRYLMSKLKDAKQQIIIATHSPAIAESFELTEIRLLQHRNGLLDAFSICPDAIARGRAKTFMYLKRRLVEAYFSKAIFLIEGDTEEGAFLAFNQSLYRNGQGLDMNKQELTLFNSQGYTEIGLILEALQPLPIKKILLLDNDKEDAFYESLAPRTDLLIRLPKTPAGDDFEGMIAWQSPLSILNQAIQQQMEYSETDRQLPHKCKNKIYLLKKDGRGNPVYIDQLLSIKKDPSYFGTALPILIEWEKEHSEEKHIIRWLYSELFREFKGSRSAYEWASLYKPDQLPKGIIDIFGKISETIGENLPRGTQYVISQ